MLPHRVCSTTALPGPSSQWPLGSMLASLTFCLPTTTLLEFPVIRSVNCSSWLMAQGCEILGPLKFGVL
uniref:Uncharacterized protein n=1 Tax=Arundo donax TaxID=35708 RepID=A0A0A9DC96_ARUDO